jgi:hypothetical protein
MSQLTENHTEKSVQADKSVYLKLLVTHSITTLALCVIALMPVLPFGALAVALAEILMPLATICYASIVVVFVLSVYFERIEFQQFPPAAFRLYQFALSAAPVLCTFAGGWAILPWVMLFSLIIAYFVVMFITSAFQVTQVDEEFEEGSKEKL